MAAANQQDFRVKKGLIVGTEAVNIGSGQMYKDASGNVGIGTSVPGSILDISRQGAALRISDPTFIPFDDLTEEQVKQWVLDTMGEEQVAALQANLNNQIEAQKHPVTATGLPW